MMPEFVVSWLAKSVLMQSPLGAFIKTVPAWAWKLAAIAAAALLLFLWHQGTVRKHNAELVKSTLAAEDARIARRALELKGRIDALTGKISTLIKDKNREENSRIARVASDVLVRGPGKAVCPGVAGIPGAAGRYVAAAGPPNARLDPVPDPEREQLIALPFAPAIAFAQGHDQCETDLRAYREWGDQIMKIWPKSTGEK